MDMEQVINREIATEEINEWLDFKRIRQARRDDNEDNIEVLIEAMMYGDLVKDGNKLTHRLVEPLGGDADNKSTVTYDPRVKQSKIINVQNRNKVKSTDHQSLMACYVAAITGESFGLVRTMVTEDWRVAQAIVLFFT